MCRHTTNSVLAIGVAVMVACGGSTGPGSSDPDILGDSGSVDTGLVDTSAVDEGASDVVACLKTSPAEVDFGEVDIKSFGARSVHLTNCGYHVLEISNVALSGDSSTYFDLDLQSLGEFSADKPLVLPPGEETSFIVRYLPKTVSKDSNGNYLPDTGTILVGNSSAIASMEIPVIGMATYNECPVADFTIFDKGMGLNNGAVVLVQSTLDFLDQSIDPDPAGGIAGYEWSVIKPPGSADVFNPSPTFNSPQFTVNVVGNYLFRLDVVNKKGIESCNQAMKSIQVKAGQGAHIELTWITPEDLDPTDQCFAGMDCGSDMDLHVVHPNALTPPLHGFFDTKYDCFWFNPHPIWVENAAMEAHLQPHLDRDDTDGAGPENFNYVSPEDGKCYKVGVHYWDDHNYGISYPTIRVFVDGNLVYQRTGPGMVMHGMWVVGEACFTDEDQPFIEYSDSGGPVIVHDYVDPDFNFTP